MIVAVRIAIAWLALGFVSRSYAATTAAPDWLTDAMAAPVTVATDDADAVILLREELLQIEPDGVRVRRERFVVKVLTANGRQHAQAVTRYLSGSSQVSSFKAWLVKPGGGVVTLGKADVIDVAAYGDALELYSESRQQFLRATGSATAGCVFGAESIVRERTILNQEVWHFSSRLPTERSTYALRLAGGWQVKTRSFNRAPVAPAEGNGTQSWTLTALPAEADEPIAPPASTVTPWLAIDLIPPANSAEARAGVANGSWSELAKYFAIRYDVAAKPEPALVAQANALVAGATNSWERLQRLTQFVQGVNYIQVTLDAANAGGLIPRPATRVLQCNYGDCKDKATLLRALLAAVGVKSYPLIVRAQGALKIDPDWPAVAQFNHCIVAIAVESTMGSAACIEHPALGKLLVFDPTDENTPVGLLDRSWLSDRALLLASDAGGLIELPAEPAEAGQLIRTIEAQLDELGNVTARLEERCLDLAAAGARGPYVAERGRAYQENIESWLGRTLPALRGVTVTANDLFPVPEFRLVIEFVSRDYGKRMRNELLAFKPALVARRDALRLAKKPRTLPIAIKAQAYEERAVFALPANFEVDEMLAPLAVETEFGSYRASARMEGGRLIFQRSLKLRTVDVPASDYEKVRSFFDRVTRSEQSPIVLRRLRDSAPRAANPAQAN